MIDMNWEDLLAPISNLLPAGSDQGYAPDYDDIRKWRKGDDPSLSQGEWVTELRTPQWAKVRESCRAILVNRSKDLEVACWYLEALAATEGITGLAFGFKVIDGLFERFGVAGEGGLFPRDPEERIARLEWLDVQLPPSIKDFAVTGKEAGAYTFTHWQESRDVENRGLRTLKDRNQAIQEGKVSGEAWDRAVLASGRAFYQDLADQLNLAGEALAGMELRLRESLGEESPGLPRIREALEGCTRLVAQASRKFDGEMPEGRVTERPHSSPEAVEPAGSPSGRKEAIQRLREVARYFREYEPHSPVGLLAERAARWGEMPLEAWLTRVIKDEQTLGQLRDLLDFEPHA